MRITTFSFTRPVRNGTTEENLRQTKHSEVLGFDILSHATPAAKVTNVREELMVFCDFNEAQLLQ